MGKGKLFDEHNKNMAEEIKNVNKRLSLLNDYVLEIILHYFGRQYLICGANAENNDYYKNMEIGLEISSSDFRNILIDFVREEFCTKIKVGIYESYYKEKIIVLDDSLSESELLRRVSKWTLECIQYIDELLKKEKDSLLKVKE